MNDATVPAPPKRIDAKQFLSLLREPLGALGVAFPTLKVCEELCIWLPMPPTHTRERGTNVSAKLLEKAIAFENALPEAEAFWALIRQNAMQRLLEDFPDDPESQALHLSGFDSAVTDKFTRLRNALSECRGLIQEHPRPFTESWHEPATTCAMVFSWVVGRSDRGKDVGVSQGGPLVRFVSAALSSLSWQPPSEAAVVKHLQRALRDGEWSIPIRHMDSKTEPICPGQTT